MSLDTISSNSCISLEFFTCSINFLVFYFYYTLTSLLFTSIFATFGGHNRFYYNHLSIQKVVDNQHIIKQS